jgi:mono/diheme cytochrome c family protein
VRQARALALAAVAAAGAACSTRPPSGADAGRAYFAQAGCATCHRIGGEGGQVGPNLTLVGFRRSSAWLDLWLKSPESWRPGTLMPDPRLSPPARRALVAFLSARRGQDWLPGRRPWDRPFRSPVARGALIFSRAGCSGCHGPAGAGGEPNNNVRGGAVPSLRGLAQAYTKAELVEKIRRGVAAPQKADPDGPDPLVRMPAWGSVLDDAELSAVADYLLTLKPSAPAPSDW